MIDWVTILLALVIIAALVGGFGFVAWKINMSDPLTAANLSGKKDEGNQLFDAANDKKRKDKNATDQKKKKRNVQKKSKRDTKEDDETEHVVKFKEPSDQASEETDNEREESEQESTAAAAPQVAEASSKARKRKNKARAGASAQSSGPVEGILLNKDEKSPVVERAQPILHTKLATAIPKDEVELARQHQQQGKTQAKASQPSQKQSVPAPVTSAKKTAPPPAANGNQGTQKQPQAPRQEQQEQPFTTVVGKGHKTPAPAAQQQQQQPSQPPQQPLQQPQQQSQQQQQQQVKPVSVQPAAPTLVAPASAQQQAPAQVQHEQLGQRQPARQQREAASQPNGHGSNSVSAKPAAAASTSAAPAKLADLVKALPTSQVVVTELMSALDAFPLSADELNIIMQKIANKQFLIKHDWSKLQYGQKVDPQVHIGQMLDESARAYEEDMKTNAVKRMKELSDELNTEKRRVNDLLKEANEKDVNIQLLRTQLSSIQHPQQQHFQTYEAEYRRLGEENMQLKQRLAQQQQHFQQQQQQQHQHQQQLSSLNLINNNSDAMSVQARVVEDQIKKLSIDNGKLEKQIQTRDLTIKEMQKEKENFIRTNQQLTQKAQEGQKQFQQNEDKLLKELNENRTLQLNQLNECKRRIEELESKNEQLQRAEAAHVNPPTLNNEERDKFEQEINQLKQQLTHEKDQYQKQHEDIKAQYQSKENELRQEIEQLKNNAQQRQQEESLTKELADKTAQIAALQTELNETKARNDTSNSQSEERFRQEQDKQKQFLTGLLDEGVRNQLPQDNQDFGQWLSSYQQIFASSNDTSKRALQEETEKLKHENDQLLKNMNDVENQLKDIEQAVQSKEESLLADLQSKDATLESIQTENEQLTGEMQRLRAEIDRLQQAHQTAVDEGQAFKRQLDERSLLTELSSSSNADESFEIIKQSPSSPTEGSTRIDQLHELIRSGKEALENQDAIAQQLDKHLNDMHRSGIGETSTTTVDESAVPPSSTEEQPALAS